MRIKRFSAAKVVFSLSLILMFAFFSCDDDDDDADVIAEYTHTDDSGSSSTSESLRFYDDDTFVISAEGYALFAGECVFDSSAQEIKSETLKVASGLIYAYSQSYGETYGSKNSLSLLEWSEDWGYWESSEITFTFYFEEEKEFCVISDPLGYFDDDDIFERQ